MDVIELARVSAEFQRLAAFLEQINLHPSLWKANLIECDGKSGWWGWRYDLVP